MPATRTRFSAPDENISSRLNPDRPVASWYWGRSHGPFSSTSTERPARARRWAMGAPPAPLPMITASTCSVAIVSAPVVRAGAQRLLHDPPPVEQRVAVAVGEAVFQPGPTGAPGVAAVLGMGEGRLVGVAA